MSKRNSMDKPHDRSIARRRLLGASAAAALGAVVDAAPWAAGALRAASAQAASATVFDARVTFDPGRASMPINRLVLGANVQWVDHGDELLSPGTLQLRPAMTSALQALGPTLLRYPGGTLSDNYRWARGTGSMQARGQGEHYWSRQKQVIEMGTPEVLELCRVLGAEPLFTVNVVTGTAAEAAQWVTATNKTRFWSQTNGAQLPKVKYWEIGNEPYLKDDARPDLWLAPAEFVRRAALFAKAMRAADPSIMIGVPGRSDTIGGIQLSPYKGFNDLLLPKVAADIDFIALHNAYLPFGVDRDYSDDEFYWGAMAASEVIAADFVSTRAQLARLAPGKNIRLAVTEYNAIFTLTMDRKKSDAYINSLAGAIYVADALRVFSSQPDLLAAVFHSLSGNWHFGLVSNRDVLRPAYFVLQGYSNLLRGKLVPLQIDTETFGSSRVGVVPDSARLPLVTGLGTLDQKTARLVLINKDLKRSTHVALTVTGMTRASDASYVVLDGTNVFDTTDSDAKIARRRGTAKVSAGLLTLDLPPHSITFAEMLVE